MSRQKKYLDVNVLDAALDRIRHIFDIHDTVAVCFSGGKDSLVALHLVKQVAEERGQSTVNVVFRDEELIHQCVIDFVDEYRKQPWVKMLYFAVPLASTKFILGKVINYVQWDPSRAHLRPIPEHAIRTEPGDTRVFDQYSMDEFTATFYRGKVALVTGIRAEESLMRFRASVNKLNENYINASSSRNVQLCKPIYDWLENDVFRFFFERGIKYCPVYDSQMWSGEKLRVSTPLHAERAKSFGALRAIDPGFYQGVVTLFPEMLVQERYYWDLDREKLRERYGQDMDGIRAYILENIEEEEQQHKALARLATIEGMARKSPGSWPVKQVLNYFLAGSFKRMMLPVPTKKK